MNLPFLSLLDSSVTVQADANHPNTKEKNDDCGSVSKVKELTIHHPNSWTQECFNYLLLNLYKIPLLSSFDLASSGSMYIHERPTFFAPPAEHMFIPDLSTSLVTFLDGSPGLKKLEICGFKFDHKALCCKLEGNSRLKTLIVTYPDMKTDRKPEKFYLELLKNHNTTLKTLHRVHTENPVIDFFLRLNRLGRAQARHPSVTLGQFLWLLSQAQPKTDRRLYRSSEDEALSVSFLFGLLRELPGKWCGPMPRKMTHGEQDCISVHLRKGWTNVASAGSPAIGRVELRWYTNLGEQHIVEGTIALQRFAETPLYRLAYNGKRSSGYNEPSGGAGYLDRDVLYLPDDVSCELHYAQQNDGYHRLRMIVPPGDPIDSIRVYMSCKNEAEHKAGLSFVQAFFAADQERRRYFLGTKKEDNIDH